MSFKNQELKQSNCCWLDAALDPGFPICGDTKPKDCKPIIWPKLPKWRIWNDGHVQNFTMWIGYCYETSDESNGGDRDAPLSVQFTTFNSSCRKVMFSQVSVNLFMGQDGYVWGWVCTVGGDIQGVGMSGGMSRGTHPSHWPKVSPNVQSVNRQYVSYWNVFLF